MMNKFSVCFFAIVLFAACNKKEPAAPKAVAPVRPPKVIVTDKPVYTGESGPTLPAGATLTIDDDGYSIGVQLPVGFTFMDKSVEPVTNSTQPVGYATYRCNCSGAGTACQVMYADGGGFGCLHSSCSGSCEGAFTYKGYVLNRVTPTQKKDFLADELVQQKIAAQFAIVRRTDAASKRSSGDLVYVKQSLYGVSYYFLLNENALRSDLILEVIPFGKAVCDCEGTKACTLKTLGIAMDKNSPVTNKIYYCDGPCNGCELTVN
jgi:hypothetical protein